MFWLQAIKFIPKALPTRATCDPIRPSPRTPRVFARRSVPTRRQTLLLTCLPGISRVTFQMGVSTLLHQEMLDSIEILGTQVAPIVRSKLGVIPVRR